jgi:uncharacterized protein
MLIYLHGFNSTPESKKAGQLKHALAERNMGERYACPALSHWPVLAMQIVIAEIGKHPAESITLVGSSLGGFYATYLAEEYGLRAVLLNPAVYPHRDLIKMLGPQRNLYSGEEYELTPRHVRQLEQMVVPKITPRRYLLIAETGDEVLDYREAVERYQGARKVIVPGGDHALQSFSVQIPRIIEFAGLGRT